MASIDLNPIGGIATAVGGLLDDLFTSDEERLRAAIESRRLDIEEDRIDAELLKGQQEVNKEEAKHSSILVAGWRPYVGWVCGFGLTYQFLIYPLLLQWPWRFAQAMGWIPRELDPPPVLDLSVLLTLLVGLLGLSTQRSIERIKGKARSNLKEQ